MWETGEVGSLWKSCPLAQPGHWSDPNPSQPSFSTALLRILGGCGCSPPPFFRPETELLYCLLRARHCSHASPPVLCRSLDVFL